MNPLAVVIPSKTASNLVPCVAAVRQHEPDARIIVIDDGVNWHDDGWNWNGKEGLENHPRTPFEIHGGEKPFIFARNANIGIRAAGNADVVLLNDDALLESPGGFSLMRRAAAEHPEYGIISSSVNGVGNVNQWNRGIGLREDPRMVCFVAVLLPRRTINLVGELDERFIGYGFEDDDMCLRIRRAGLKIGIHDGCKVQHGKLPSTFRSPGGPGGDLTIGAKLFREKWGAGNKDL